MASQEYKRKQAIIAQRVSDLIKSLTDFKEGDENFKIIQHFALSHIQSGRYLSANSHEVKRRVEGVCEKFQIANYGAYAHAFQQLVDAFVSHPGVSSHSEHDIQWSLLLFLFEVAQNPIAGLKKSLQSGLPILQEYVPETVDSPMDVTKDQNPSEFGYYDEDSELSDWTESELESEAEEEPQKTPVPSPAKPALPPKPVTIVSKLEPPKRVLTYKPFESHLAESWLKENVQPGWWGDSKVVCAVTSKYPSATFCEFWNQLLARASYNYIKLEQICTLSEFCLVREICWMFVRPANTRFFRLEGDRVRLQSNISVPSVTVRGMHSFLREFAEKMTIMHLLRQFCQRVLGKPGASHTFEAYASELSLCLDRVVEVVLEKEKALILQLPGTIETAIELCSTLRPQFVFLEHLWFIHRSAVLDWSKYPPHVCAAHLLAGLAMRILKAKNRDVAALASALYIRSLKAYLEIVDIWWSEGRFEDWLEEFLVAPTRFPEMTTAAYSPRFCHVESVTVSAGKVRLIEKDNVVRVLLQHAVMAGDTLNILSRLDRMSEIKELTKRSSDESLYAIFVSSVLAKLEKFRTEPVPEPQEPEPAPDPMKISTMTESVVSVDENRDLEARMGEFKDEIREMGNDLLLMSLQESLSAVEPRTEEKKETLLFERLQGISTLLVPFHVVIVRVLEEILVSKLRIADELVLRIYREELQLAQHLRNLRQVYFLEATVAMQNFFVPLFQDIEAGKAWANPYMLTSQLSHAMSSVLSDSTNLFNVEIRSEFRCSTTSVLESINEVSIFYAVGDDLVNIIKPTDLERYNKIFRFLLKVKWAVWTLENLHFPKAYKNRRPYAPLSILDFTMRRLIIIRTWATFYINCIHSHLVHQVVINLDVQLNRYIENAKNLGKIINAHQAFISLAYDNSFLHDSYVKLRENLIEMFKLVSVVRHEWNNVGRIMELDRTEEIGDLVSSSSENIEAMEKAYIDLHTTFVKHLEFEVYKKGRRHLGELLAAFSSSMPV